MVVHEDAEGTLKIIMSDIKQYSQPTHTIYFYAFMICFYMGIMYLGVRHIKVIPADKGKCGIDETNPYDSCIEYVGEDKDTICLVSFL